MRASCSPPSLLQVPTPWGGLVLLAHAGQLQAVHFADSADLVREGASPGVDALYCCLEDQRLLQQAARQLDDYLAGRLRTFDLPLQPRGTAFQRAVWSTLARWPYGRALSYAELATAAGRASAVRAVGNAVGANPWVIVVPCHRVLASGGRLGGFSSGLPRKRALLRHERIAWHDDAGSEELPLFGADVIA